MSNSPYVYEKQGTLVRKAWDDPMTGDFVLATEQDCEPIIEENKILRENQTKKEEFRLMARVPVHVAELAMREGWFHDDEAWKRWMNDPDNRDFRVDQGRV